MSVLLLWLCLQDVPELIRQLDDDEIELRESAEAGLVKAGPGILPEIYRAQTGSDGERRLRLGRVAERLNAVLRVAAFKGGEPVSGFSLRVKATQESYAVGDSIKLTVEVLNVTDGELSFSTIDGIDWSAPRRVGSYKWSHLKIAIVRTSTADDDAYGGRFGGWRSGGNEPRVKPKPVASGATMVLTEQAVATVSTMSDGEKARCSPGEYDVVVTHYAQSKSLLKGATADLVSNTLKIKVTVDK